MRLRITASALLATVAVLSFSQWTTSVVAGTSSKPLNGSGGGVVCAACTIILGLLGNESHPIPPPSGTHLDSENWLPNVLALTQWCKQDKSTHDLCSAQNHLRINELLKQGDSPDAICRDIGLCTDPTCQLYPKDLQEQRQPTLLQQNGHERLRAVRRLLQHAFPMWSAPTEARPSAPSPDLDHYPAVDNDGDHFSTWPFLRGSNWRGKDCNDSNAAFYPGSAKFAIEDHNCNGIHGVDPNTKRPYEVEFCLGSEQRGLAILGDSAGAHFSVPTTKVLNSIESALDLALDEGDFPQCSWATGFEPQNSTSSSSSRCPKSRLPMISFYQRLRERNRCNHRDFQNIAVNGARSTSMYNGILETLARHPYDQPAIVFYALVGNDVCNPHPGSEHMTTPDQFHEMVVNALQYLDTVLPQNSHVLFVGLLPGKMMWKTMSHRPHPSLNPVTYATLWDYLNCLQVNPCWGWLNSNETWRDFTSTRAEQLNDVYKAIVSNYTFSNFDVMYMDYPINQTVVDNWAAQGYDPAELFDWIGGGHPSQTAHMLTAKYLWEELERSRPDILGPVNPHNQNISTIFGEQGGY